MSKEKKAEVDIGPEEEMSWVDRVPKGASYFEESDFMLLAEAGDYDIFFVTCFFRFGGGKKGIYQVDDVAAIQTALLVTPKNQRGKMNDNPFIGNRIYPTDWESKAKITRNKEEVVWEIEKCKFICNPSRWELKGSHMGVEWDLKAKGVGHPAFFAGRYEDLPTTGSTGFGQPFLVEGTIKADGKTHQIKAAGAHDHVILTVDLVQMYDKNRINYYWVSAVDQATYLHIYAVPGITTYNHVRLNNQDIDMDKAETTITPLEYWIDPRTGLQLPVRWNIHLRAENGVLDVSAVGYARALYGFLSRSGTTIHNGIYARFNGKFYSKDGKVIDIKDLPAWVEWGRALFPLESGAP